MSSNKQDLEYIWYFVLFKFDRATITVNTTKTTMVNNNNNNNRLLGRHQMLQLQLAKLILDMIIRNIMPSTRTTTTTMDRVILQLLRPLVLQQPREEPRVPQELRQPR